MDITYKPWEGLAYQWFCSLLPKNSSFYHHSFSAGCYNQTVTMSGHADIRELYLVISCLNVFFQSLVFVRSSSIPHGQGSLYNPISVDICDNNFSSWKDRNGDVTVNIYVVDCLIFPSSIPSSVYIPVNVYIHTHDIYIKSTYIFFGKYPDCTRTQSHGIIIRRVFYAGTMSAMIVWGNTTTSSQY